MSKLRLRKAGKRNAGKAWTRSETQKIAMRARQHVSPRRIASELGRTLNAVYKRASQKRISLAPRSR